MKRPRRHDAAVTSINYNILYKFIIYAEPLTVVSLLAGNEPTALWLNVNMTSFPKPD